MTDAPLKFLPGERLPGSPGCFMCDNAGINPRALGLVLMWDVEAGLVQTAFEPDETWCGFEGVVHGGLTAGVLDEVMAWVVRQVSGDWGFTAECTLRYKGPLEPGKAYTAEARVIRANKRLTTTEAVILDSEGRVMAQASATFVAVRGRAAPRGEVA